MSTKNFKKYVFLLPIFAGIFWGMAGFFVRTLTERGMSTVTLLESRAWIATLVLAIFMFFKDRSLFRIPKKGILTIAVAALVGTLGLNLCYNYSINQLSLSLAAVLLGLSPVFVVLIAAPLFKERITLKKGICTLAAFFGCVLVSGVLEVGTGLSWTVIGLIIGVLSGFFYALYSIFCRIAIDQGCNPLTIAFYGFFILTVVLIPFTQWDIIGTMMITNPLQNNLFLIAHALCMTIIPYLLYNTALNYMETGIVSVLASTEPVAAMVFGILLYSEIPSPLSLLGLVIVLVALAVLSLSKE